MKYKSYLTSERKRSIEAMSYTDHATSGMTPEPGPRTVRAPRGTALSCKGWQQEAPMRMIMNNLDPDVAEKPDELIVYGGIGKAARNWECFDRIVETLKNLSEE